MHAGSEQTESASATKRVVHGECDDGSRRDECRHNDSCGYATNIIQRPLVAIEEPMKVAPRSITSGIRRDNQISDIPMPMRKHPPGHQRRPQRKTRSRETNREPFEQSPKAATKFHDRRPCRVRGSDAPFILTGTSISLSVNPKVTNSNLDHIQYPKTSGRSTAIRGDTVPDYSRPLR